MLPDSGFKKKKFRKSSRTCFFLKFSLNSCAPDRTVQNLHFSFFPGGADGLRQEGSGQYIMLQMLLDSSSHHRWELGAQNGGRHTEGKSHK